MATSIRRVVTEQTYYIGGKAVKVQLVRYVPAVPVSQMFSYVSGEDVSCEEKKMSYGSDSSTHPVWTLATWRRIVVNRKTEYKCMTKAEAEELKSLVCSENVSLSLTNQLNGWWTGSLTEKIKGDWYRVHERYLD